MHSLAARMAESEGYAGWRTSAWTAPGTCKGTATPSTATMAKESDTKTLPPFLLNTRVSGVQPPPSTGPQGCNSGTLTAAAGRPPHQCPCWCLPLSGKGPSSEAGPPHPLGRSDGSLCQRRSASKRTSCRRAADWQKRRTSVWRLATCACCGPVGRSLPPRPCTLPT